MFKIYKNLYINKKNKWSKSNTFKSPIKSNTGIKTLRIKKHNQIELKKRRRLHIIRELGKTYLKISIKIKV